LFNEKYGARLSVVLKKRSGYTDGDGFFERMAELMRSALPEVPLSFDLEHEDNNYYKGINFKLYMEKGSETVEIGDGGFVDWIAKMISNKKARCLISGVGMDRLLLL
jgi:histidyl-tRNA synthetase